MPVLAPTTTDALRTVRRTLDDAHASLVGCRVLALCSGGVDSVVLVDVLGRLPRGAAPRTVDVVWCDHGVRVPAPDAERRAAERIARAHGFAFHVVQRGADRGSAQRAGGTQAAARAWRYAEVARLARRLGSDVVATGHTASDQVESALLGLVGVTASGLARGMRVERPLDGDLAGAPLRLVRPLLAVDRSGVLAHASAHELVWVEDPSNADPHRYVRNAIRHDVVPRLLAAAPGAGRALARSASRTAEREAAVSGLAEALLEAWCGGVRGAPLDVRPLRNLPAPARRALLARWLPADLGRHLTTRLLDAIEQLAVVRSNRPAPSLHLPGGACVRRAGYDLTYQHPSPDGDLPP